jgi:hypothetical protein
MSWVLCTLAMAFVGLVPCAVELPLLRRNPRRFRFWLTIVLALTPFPLAFGILHHAANVTGFIIAP